MNHFVYNLLSALSYHISKESFIVAKRWYSLGLFAEVIAIFSHSNFKKLSKENQQIIYSKINELRNSNISISEKKNWLIVCKEQLENIFDEENEQSLKRRK